MLTDEHDELVQRFRDIFANALDEQAERFKAELSAGVDAEREEWIKVWFLYRKLNQARIAKEEEERGRPRFLN
jgi:hypothetical protein